MNPPLNTNLIVSTILSLASRKNPGCGWSRGSQNLGAKSIREGTRKVNNCRCDKSYPVGAQEEFNASFILCFHSRGQHLCKFIATKENVYIRKEFNSHRTGLGHKHGRRFIVLGHKYGSHNVMWKPTIISWWRGYFKMSTTPEKIEDFSYIAIM